MRAIFNFCSVLMALSFFSLAANANFTLVNNHSGERFQCRNHNGGGGGGGGTDPSCVRELSTFCNGNTSYSRDTCFNLATERCASAAPGYASCVNTTSTYCNQNTSYSRDTCFNRAVESCQGNSSSIIELMEGVRSEAVKMRISLE